MKLNKLLKKYISAAILLFSALFFSFSANCQANKNLEAAVEKLKPIKDITPGSETKEVKTEEVKKTDEVKSDPKTKEESQNTDKKAAETKNEKLEVKDQKLELNPQEIPKEDIEKTIDSLLMNKKASSLMFDDNEADEIHRAVQSYKNNQDYTPSESDSLLSEEEANRLAEAERQHAEQKKVENEKSYAHLSSMIYVKKNDWVVWINDKKITPQSNDKEKELYLKLIKKGLVKVVWKMSLSKWKILSGKNSESDAPSINENSQVVIEFFLKPNQSFSLTANEVVEGKGSSGQKPSETLGQQSEETLKSF